MLALKSWLPLASGERLMDERMAGRGKKGVLSWVSVYPPSTAYPRLGDAGCTGSRRRPQTAWQPTS